MDNFAKIVEAIAENPYSNILSVKQRSKLLDCVVSEQRGREITIGDNRLIDFASCNYLGLDLNQNVIQAIPKYLEAWGTHPSWARIIASPLPYENLEAELAKFIDVEHTLALPTLTITHYGILRVLAGSDGIFIIDKHAHKTIYDAAVLATATGAKIFSFSHNDLNQVESILQKNSKLLSNKIICVDGVYSMSGEYAPIDELQKLATKYGAVVYIDDAHGIGVIGEKQNSKIAYGNKGNGIVKHLGLSYENIIYVSGLSKAFSSLVAFIACPSLKIKDTFKSLVTSYSHSGPVPTASLASALESLRINTITGDLLRERLFSYSKRVCESIEQIGLTTTNVNYFPIISVVVGNTDTTERIGNFLFKNGVLSTLGVYPYSPKEKGVIRLSITSAHTEDQINILIETLADMQRVL